MTRLGIALEDEKNKDDDFKNDTERMKFESWSRRYKDVRVWCIYVNTSNLFYQMGALMAPKTKQHMYMNWLYMLITFFCYFLLYKSFSSKRKMGAQI